MAMKKKSKAKKMMGKAWRSDEIKKLREAYKTRPASKIAKEMRRSLASVRGKISALKLRKGPSRKAKAGKKRGRC